MHLGLRGECKDEGMRVGESEVGRMAGQSPSCALLSVVTLQRAGSGERGFEGV